MSNQTNKLPIESIIAIAAKAILVAKDLIGSVEWKGRFRNRVNDGLETLTRVNEEQQVVIESQQAVIENHQVQIADLDSRLKALEEKSI